MMKKVEKQLRKMRKATWELYALYQIPSRLCFAICDSDAIQDKQDVTFFIGVTKELMRVRGYYKDPKMNKAMNEEFTRLYDLYKNKKGGSNT